MVSKRRSNTIAAIGTLLVLLMLFLVLWFVRLYSIREQEDEGIEVAFGVAEDGGGFQPHESESAPSSSVAPPPTPSKPSPNDLMVQEDEESLALQKQREEEHKQMDKAAAHHAREADRQQREQNAQDEHDAAHRGRAAFGFVPLDLAFDLLSGLLLSQPGTVVFTERGGKEKRQNKGAHELYRHLCFLISR